MPKCLVVKGYSNWLNNFLSASHYITCLILLKEWATHLFDLISIIEIGMYAYAAPFHKSKQENHIKNGLSLTLAYDNIWYAKFRTLNIRS